MQLSDEEKRMLAGERGPAVRKSMEILTALGDIYGAERMVPVKSAHISGANIIVAGEAGTRFVEEMSKSVERLAAFTTLNPCAMDRTHWQDLGLRPEEVEPQIRLTRAYEKMGAFSCHSCVPYFVGNVPRFGEHVAWAESSAVSYANSVLGARTNREGGPSALAAAITGRAPAYGLHLPENRRGRLLVEVTAKIEGFFDYGNLGYYVGAIAQDQVPVFTGLPAGASNDELKSLASALASSGAVGLYHAVGVTPEAPTIEHAFGGPPPKTGLKVGRQELVQAAEKLSCAKGSAIDWVFVGCPHLSIQELAFIAAILRGKRLHPGIDLWVCTSLGIKTLADVMGYSADIEAAGARMVVDTCPVVTLSREIAQRKGFQGITTDSAKMAHYMPGQFDIMPRYGDTEKCLAAALSGRWE
jgi:predicted aconitase